MAIMSPSSIAERVSKVNYVGSDVQPNPFKPEPLQIMSLWDMIKYNLRGFHHSILFLKQAHREILNSIEQRGPDDKVRNSGLGSLTVLLPHEEPK